MAYKKIPTNRSREIVEIQNRSWELINQAQEHSYHPTLKSHIKMCKLVWAMTRALITLRRRIQ